MNNKKEHYDAPTLFVVELKTEGMICQSGEILVTMDDTFEEIIL